MKQPSSIESGTNTRFRFLLSLLVVAGIGAIGFGLVSLRAAVGDITLSNFVTAFNNPIGIDFHEDTAATNGLGDLIASVNYSNGQPNNLDLISVPGGAHTIFSPSLVGLTEELKIATVRTSPGCQQFPVGDVFTGNGKGGEIVRIRKDGVLAYGQAANNPGVPANSSWVKLPGETNLLRGSLYVDRFCAFGGDLIVVTGGTPPANTGGDVWRVKQDGTASLVKNLGNIHLEGVITLANDPKYGPWAGTILAGAEGDAVNLTDPGLVYSITAAGVATAYTLIFTDTQGIIHPMKPEDLDLIEAGQDFFGVNFANSRVLRAPASEFAPFVGDILLTQEMPCGSKNQFVTKNCAGLPANTTTSGLYAIHYVGTGGNAAGGLFKVTPFTFAAGSITVIDQWEHVTLAPLGNPHLTVNKTPDGGTFNVNGQTSFTIVVGNNGVVPATNVNLTDALPGNGGLVWTTATPSQGTCVNPIAANALNCSLGTIAVGGSVTVTVTSAASTPTAACTSQPNPAAIATADGGITAQDSGSLSCTIPLNPPQLRVVKTPDAGTFTQGGQTTFTIVVSNPATPPASPATNVQLTDALPGNGGLVWVTATTTQGTCVSPIVGNSLSCSLGSIAAGASVTVTVKSAATTPAAACQSQPNPIAQATADGGLTAQDAGSLTCTPPGPIQTVTQGGWGAPAHGNNPGTILNAYFAAHPGSIVIGGGGCVGAKTLTFTNADAIRAFLPQGGPPGVLNQSQTDPISRTSAGVFAGQVLALKLNVTIFNGLGGFVLPSGPAAGKTVNQVLADANKALGGCGLPAYAASISALNDIVDTINNMFD